jgi:tagatose 1,6-diphosphate aldolase GatY/KbaY
LARSLIAVGAQAPVPCCVQLDHVDDLDTMEAALGAGVGALMADGSKLPYDDNVELVGAAVRLAETFGAGVEAELGRIEGDEEVASAAAAGKLTEPAQADAFVSRTGAACLAVSIGNAHGRYERAPQLDLERLARIDAATDCSLSLHGASGLPDGQLTACVQRGIRKVNVNTELRDRYFDVLAERGPELREGARLLALQGVLIEALAAVVDAKLALFAAEDAARFGAPPSAGPSG